MATRRELQAAERSFRRLLTDQSLPAPDEVEYRATSIACLWHDTKTCIVIEVDKPPDGLAEEPPNDGSGTDDSPVTFLDVD